MIIIGVIFSSDLEIILSLVWNDLDECKFYILQA